MKALSRQILFSEKGRKQYLCMIKNCNSVLRNSKFYTSTISINANNLSNDNKLNSSYNNFSLERKNQSIHMNLYRNKNNGKRTNSRSYSYYPLRNKLYTMTGSDLHNTPQNNCKKNLSFYEGEKIRKWYYSHAPKLTFTERCVSIPLPSTFFLMRNRISSSGALFSTTSIRSNSKKQKGKRLSVKEMWNLAQENKTKVPPLQTTIRRLLMKVHPDHFTHYPKEKSINADSLSTFQSLMDDIKDGKTMPPVAKTHKLKFYLRTDIDGKFDLRTMELRTTGGDCRNIIKEGLGNFFQECGLPKEFEYSEMDWTYSRPEEG